uniref:hypothetical protein n=1 Tax=Erythrolobus coxiae TaxID=362235 RepID=UPI001FCD2688|nr:hypothetical protein MW556_mgp18 [Erythrolobus coxiae]UNJ19005.1 hypothetical protein [Erythrolobus coxiae]
MYRCYFYINFLFDLDYIIKQSSVNKKQIPNFFFKYNGLRVRLKSFLFFNWFLLHQNFISLSLTKKNYKLKKNQFFVFLFLKIFFYNSSILGLNCFFNWNCTNCLCVLTNFVQSNILYMVKSCLTPHFIVFNKIDIKSIFLFSKILSYDLKLIRIWI